MAEIPDSVREVIEAGKLAHLVTLNKDGSPQVSIVWLGIEGDELVCAHLAAYQKVRNVQRALTSQALHLHSAQHSVGAPWRHASSGS